MKKLLVLLLLTFVCYAPTHVHAMDHHMQECKECGLHKPGMGHMEKMGEMMGMCLANADKIGLSDEQVKKISPIHREMQKKQLRFNADLKIAEMEMMEIMEVKDFDLEKALAATKKVADLKTAHHSEMLKSMKEVRAVFTEEQFGKMKKLMHKDMKMSGKKPAKGMKHNH